MAYAWRLWPLNVPQFLIQTVRDTKGILKLIIRILHV